MKPIAIIMTVVFAVFTYWQLNDPDALLWVFVYGIAAIFSALFAFGKLPRSAGIAIAVLAVGGVILLAVRVISQQQPIFDEEGREMFGLLLVALWFAFVTKYRRRAPAST